ncbi:hypothetical protein CLOSTASPAR_01747 [[Clostridium] asparagiforme DSM 15981]|uniref:Uncharacterized protein n=1 Tax=[Clostridium] asparagiforme DSM 15981 TaxID=518636 RepID=C0CXM2_9FIRM|nr:hypothetical protein CLOSTASPAR_01747 [[Clostridium] asparagiforme DSM 15981]
MCSRSTGIFPEPGAIFCLVKQWAHRDSRRLPGAFLAEGGT